MDFQSANEQFRQLKNRYQAGELTEDQFKAQLQNLMGQDEQGTWWMIGYETERWYRHDGENWVQADPPGFPSQNAVAPAGPAAASKVLPAGIALGGILLLAAAAIWILPKFLGPLATPTPPPAATGLPARTEPPASADAAAQAPVPATDAPTILADTVAAGGLLFQDDFSDSNGGWSAFQNSKQSAGYSGDGQFVIRAITNNQDVWSHPGEDFSDVSIEVDATKIGGPDVNDFGVICRYQNDSNFYYFMISSDGRQAIGKFQDSNYQILSPGDFELTEAVIKGDATNHLRAVCQGSTLSFYVNGQEVSSATDTTFTGGDVGLIAGAFDEPNVEIFFDNFVVRQP